MKKLINPTWSKLLTWMCKENQRTSLPNYVGGMILGGIMMGSMLMMIDPISISIQHRSVFTPVYFGGSDSLKYKRPAIEEIVILGIPATIGVTIMVLSIIAKKNDSMDRN